MHIELYDYNMLNDSNNLLKIEYPSYDVVHTRCMKVTVEECLHECHTDLDCLGEEKCCHRDKCGVSVCISPIPEPKTGL